MPQLRRVLTAHRRAIRYAPALLAMLVCAAHAQQVWTQHGPGPNTLGQVENITDREVVGAVNTVAAHPTDANILYIGAVAGGIWKTTNATATPPLWVEQLGTARSLAIGAIVFDPTDATQQTLLAGTGMYSSFGAGGAATGLYRTVNGGANWTDINASGTLTGLNVSGVAPRGTTLVISVSSATTATNRGIWRSTDTGATFTRISGGAGTGLPAGASFDLASDPSDNTRLYTSVSGNGIFRSTDTGATWTKVSNAAMDALIGTGRIEIAVGASNNVYVAIVGGGRLTGLFRSGDSGGTWTALDLPTTTENGGFAFGIHPGGQGNTHLSIAADPTNANIVYVGGDRQPAFGEGLGLVTFPNSIGANDYSGRLFRVDASQPAGSQAAHITHSNTTTSSAPHADSRDMAFSAGGDLIETDDGGIYRRTAPSTNTGDWFSLIGNLATTEFHSIAWDSASKIVIGGAQDTGVPQQRLPVNLRWQSVATADGGNVAVDDTSTPNQSVRYLSNQFLFGFRRRTYDSANTLIAQASPARTVIGGGAAFNAQFYTPIAVNNVTPTRLIIAGTSVYESLDQGDTMTEIGPGIQVNDSGRNPIAYGAAGNADMLYVGSGTQVFIRTAAAPAALTQSATYPGTRVVEDIAIHLSTPNTAFVIDSTTVFRTTDAGATWTNVTGNLLTFAPGNLRSIAFSTSDANGSIVVGTDTGVFIADGPAFNVWSVLGGELPRVPVYDLDYDPVDEILAAGTLGRGAWTINLDERNPVDVALTLDLSGSMLSPACTTCAPKLDVLKDAVELFVQLWTTFTVPNDRMGVNYFRTNISEFTVGPDVLVPVAPNAGAIIADVRAQSTVPANLTAMGGGLQTSINRLTDATRPRHVLLFTDGMQNVNPMVNTSTFVIDNESGRPASGVSPTSPPTDLNSALGIKVNAIGVGSTPAFVDLLDDIASETGGLFKLTTAPDEELRRFYVEELVDVLKDFSPQLLGYRKGTLTERGVSEVFVANSTAQRIVFKVSTHGGAKIRLQILKDGTDVTQLGARIAGAFYDIWSLNLPSRLNSSPVQSGGTWEVRIAGRPGTSYEAAAIVDEAVMKFDFSVGHSDYVVNTPLQLFVGVTADGLPVIDADVTARVLAPQQSLATLLSTRSTPSATGVQFEPGATIGQRKLQLLQVKDAQFFTALQPASRSIAMRNNGDGTYTAAFPDTQVSGIYTVIFDVRGSRSDLGDYARTETRATSVRFGEASATVSQFGARPLGSGAGRRFEISVRPVDTHRNYLGPDYGHRVSVLIDGAAPGNPLVDRGDGSYSVETGVIPSGSDPTVSIRVMDKPLYDGSLSGLPAASRQRWALSLHVGVTDPRGSFGTALDSDWLAELDLEHRFSPAFALQGVLGHYTFDPHEYVNGATLYARFSAPIGSWNVYGGVGPGFYDPRSRGSAFGVSLEAGLSKALTPNVEIDAGVAWFDVFTSGDDIEFGVLRAGFKYVF